MSFIVWMLFLSSIAAVRSEEENPELSVLLRRIRDLEESLRVQERKNEEQDAIINKLLQEKDQGTSVHQTGVMSIEPEQNGGGQWRNSDLQNETISGEDMNEVYIGIKSTTSIAVQNFVKESKKTSPEINGFEQTPQTYYCRYKYLLTQSYFQCQLSIPAIVGFVDIWQGRFCL
jgi:hypothetical protein